jgi:hypothetical protein
MESSSKKLSDGWLRDSPQKSEVIRQKTEVRSQKSEDRGQKREKQQLKKKRKGSA